jgi:Tfp pilus assembly protein PilF
MLTSKPPFPSSSLLGAAVLRGKRPESASSMQPGVPRRLDFVIGKCLEYEPNRRFQSAEELARALRSRYLTRSYQVMDRPWVVRVAGILIAAVIILGAAMWWQSRQYYHPNANAERWYEEGVAALREGSYLKATLLLSNAIQQDSHFAMAHARLAEAWSNLDFDGAAQREMLIATAGESHVPALDRMYLDAIRGTLTRDFNGALANYQQILAHLPDADKAAGYVDLGMAYERAGDPTHALASFNNALRQNVDNPAPYMQKAMLETHLGDDQDANTDFDKAESLYKTEMNPEGEAELDYQRGYLANEREKTDEANAYLERALSESQHLPQPSVQLEIRALTQLSSVAYHSGEYDKAREFANEAIGKARDNQLISWSVDGLVRLASTELVEGNLSEADNHLRDAFALLGLTQQDRVLALANLTLASLRNQQHRSAEVAAPAKAAAAYYKANGYVGEAGLATLLVGRAERDQGQWQDALQTAKDLEDLARSSNSSDLLIRSEELQGGVYSKMEDYPHALDHYRIALSNAQNKPLRPYEALHCADVLWKLGQFKDAQNMLDSVPPANLDAGSIAVDALLAQLRYSPAEEKADQLIRKSSTMPFGTRRDLTLDRAFAEAALGKATQARHDLATLLGPDGQPKTENGKPMDPGDLAAFELAAARVHFATGDTKIAFDEAVKAESYFATKHLDDRDLRSSLLAALVAKSLQDTASYKSFSKKVVDIETELRDTWKSPDFDPYHSYISRPDLEIQLKGIAH